MKTHRALFPLLVIVAATFTVSVRADDSDRPDQGLAAARGTTEADEEEGPPSTLPLAKFKQAVAKVQMPGFQRMPEISADGDHGLILAGPDERGMMIMAQRAAIGEGFEKHGEGKLSRFKHKGHDAFFAQMTDEEGEEMAFIVVKYPEYRMALFISGKPVTPRAELMKLLAQVEL